MMVVEETRIFLFSLDMVPVAGQIGLFRPMATLLIAPNSISSNSCLKNACLLTRNWVLKYQYRRWDSAKDLLLLLGLVGLTFHRLLSNYYRTALEVTSAAPTRCLSSRTGCDRRCQGRGFTFVCNFLGWWILAPQLPLHIDSSRL
jgi:hypothetical protein